MYQFSRAIYRELSPQIVCSPTARDHEHTQIGPDGQPRTARWT